MEECLIKGCGKAAKSRGLCKTCYTSAANAVKRGRVPSWEFLVENGLASDAADQRSPFTQALDSTLHTLGSKKASEVKPL